MCDSKGLQIVARLLGNLLFDLLDDNACVGALAYRGGGLRSLLVSSMVAGGLRLLVAGQRLLAAGLLLLHAAGLLWLAAGLRLLVAGLLLRILSIS